MPLLPTPISFLAGRLQGDEGEASNGPFRLTRTNDLSMSLPALEVFKYYVYRDRVEETITSLFVPRDFIRSPMAQKVFILFMQSHTSR